MSMNCIFLFVGMQLERSCVLAYDLNLVNVVMKCTISKRIRPKYLILRSNLAHRLIVHVGLAISVTSHTQVNHCSILGVAILAMWAIVQ